MKKTYNRPETNMVNLETDVICGLSPVSAVNPGDGKGPVIDDNTGGIYIDAKHHNTWDTWDE